MERERKQSKIIQEYGFTKMGKRHTQIFMMFAAGFIAYAMRACLSVGIVAMTSEDPPDPSIPTYPEFKDYEGTILSSFFWGYIILQVAAGQIAEKYGPKYFLVTAIFLASLFSCFLPLMAAQFGSTGLIINRAAQGLCQGFLFPSSHYILSKWTPLKERSRIAGFVYFAGDFGTAVSMIITGEISSTSFGWPYVFYFNGLLGFIWVAFYVWLGSNSPAEHKTISFEERKYIEQTTEITNVDESKSTPWKDIAKSLPFWAIVVSHIGNNWGFWTLLTEIPTYMSSILGFDIGSNSFLSAVPYFVFSLFGVIISPLSDYIISKNILSLGNSRKLFNCIGFLFPALFLIILCFVPSEVDRSIHVIVLVLAVSTNAGMLAGFNVNHIDVSPKFAGTLMGITNTFANIASLVAPLVVDVFVTDKTDESQWMIVFLLAAGIYIFSALFFLVFGSGEIQSWNFPKNVIKRPTSVPVEHPSTSKMPA